MNKIVKLITGAVAGAALLVGMSACGTTKKETSTSQETEKNSVISVIASTNVWGSLAKELGGKYVDVTDILSNTSADAHDYEPTSNDISKFQHAQIAIVNGAGYDDWALKAAEQSKAIVIDAAQAGGKKAGDNPHVWFSSAVRNATADKITAAYEKLMPTQKETFAKLNEQWHASESELDEKIAQVAQADGKMPYGAIESIGEYLGEDLGMEDKTPEGYKRASANESEPTPSDIKAFTDALKKGDMKMLIANPQEPSAMSDQLISAADSGNVPVVNITEQMPSEHKTLHEWLDSIVKQIQETQQK